MLNRLGRCLVAWLVASSLLVSSTAAIVHTHEHSPGHTHAKCSTEAKPVPHQHSGCQHRHRHAEPVSPPEKAPQHPRLPYPHDDCLLCHFLLEHSLPPSVVELPLLDLVLEFRPATPRIVAVVADFDLPPARGPPDAADASRGCV
ncbi:MAG: hypothetical protein ACKV2Q_34990 [Planctomycetaceae bacterium]